MPHVIVKLWPGKSEQQKARLAQAITDAVTEVLHYDEESVSVAMEEISPQDWPDKVYKADIVHHAERLYKKPGYGGMARSGSRPEAHRKVLPGPEGDLLVRSGV